MSEREVRRLRRFHLVRTEDVSGVSGTGIVAEGCRFSTGKVAVVWTAKDSTSMSIFDSVAELVHVHGHEGATVVDWIDE